MKRCSVLPLMSNAPSMMPVELLGAVAQPGGGRRVYPTLFTADGQIGPLQFDSADTLRKPLAKAEF